jgi:hypothetical protein
METKGLKTLKNIKMHRIFMLSPFRWMSQEYRPLLLKMALDNPIIQVVASKLEHLTNVLETLLGLASFSLF